MKTARRGDVASDARFHQPAELRRVQAIRAPRGGDGAFPRLVELRPRPRARRVFLSLRGVFPRHPVAVARVGFLSFLRRVVQDRLGEYRP